MCKEEHCKHSDAPNPFGEAEFTPLADTGRCCVNSKPQRKSGFYWVNEENHGWIVAHYIISHWQIQGIDDTYEDYDFIEIDEKQIERNSTCNCK